MSDNPLISVIVPFYNEEQYLKECLESIKKQTYKNFEVVLVDDGSNDNSYKVAENFVKDDARFHLFHKDNGGISDTRNFGLDHSNGDYISFIDSDDCVTDDYLEYLLNLLKSNNTKLSIASHTVNNQNKKLIYKGLGKDVKLTQKEALESILLDNGVDLSPCCKLYSKELFTNIRYPKGQLFEDTATTYKTVLQCDFIAYGGESKYFYNIRYNSITTCTNFLQKMDLISNTDRMCDDIVSVFPELSRAADRRRVWAYFSTLNQYIKCPTQKDFKNEYLRIKYYLINKKKTILKGSEYSKRDKLAILCFSLGLPFYKLSWGFYQKINSKI